MIKTTMGERGDLLPVGMSGTPDGPRMRDVSFRNWTARDEKAVGAYRDKDRTLNPAQFATRVLAHFLRRFGPWDFDSMTEPERINAVRTAWGADVFHAWVQLRRRALGDDLAMSLTCGFCKFEIPEYRVDLSTMEVDVLGDDEGLERTVPLRDGFEFRGEVRKAPVLNPIRWSTYEGFKSFGDGALNTGELKAGVILGSIVGVEGLKGALVLPDNAVDEIGKFDLELLVREINAGQPGPDLSIEVPCPKCGSQIRRSVSWVYDSFFSMGGSSRSEPPTKSGENCSSSPTPSPGSPST